MLRASAVVARLGARRRLSASARTGLGVLPRIDVKAAIDDDAVARFSADGAIVLRNVVSEPWVEALRAMAERNLVDPGPLCDEHASAQGTGGRFHDDQFLWTRHETFREWVQESGVAAVAARAMGSETAHIFYDQLFVKEPGTVLRENQSLRRVGHEHRLIG